ncbi:hypothetical protein [Leucobacter muris]|uniref:hypothetical protein n=1 Tax=Leucobacter muris TaxID=1935379 RepID=UPI001E2EAF83|nr:hypothetical protein [Leucobacter muris]
MTPNALDRLLQPLMDRIVDLAAQLRATPRTEWGVVAEVDPLRVRLDGDLDPLAGTPASVLREHAVGDRVLCLIQSRRVTIVGRGSGPRRSGTIVVPSGALTQAGTSQIWATTLGVAVPAVAPPGTMIRMTALAVGTGYGHVSQVSQTPGLSTTTVRVRFTQVASSTEQNLLLLWEIVPTT